MSLGSQVRPVKSLSPDNEELERAAYELVRFV